MGRMFISENALVNDRQEMLRQPVSTTARPSNQNAAGTVTCDDSAITLLYMAVRCIIHTQTRLRLNIVTLKER